MISCLFLIGQILPHYPYPVSIRNLTSTKTMIPLWVMNQALSSACCVRCYSLLSISLPLGVQAKLWQSCSASLPRSLCSAIFYLPYIWKTKVEKVNQFTKKVYFKDLERRKVYRETWESRKSFGDYRRHKDKHPQAWQASSSAFHAETTCIFCRASPCILPWERVGNLKTSC